MVARDWEGRRDWEVMVKGSKDYFRAMKMLKS